LLSVVVPAFNEESRLPSTLPRLRDAGPWGEDAELIVVDDGSTDQTAVLALAHLAGVPGTRVLRQPHAGKGAAVRHGVLSALGERVVFMDADLATDLRELPRLVEALDDADVAVGSRVLPEAVVTGWSPRREALNRGFSWHARTWAGVGVSDPQCGFKGFRQPAARALFTRSRINGFGFDVEILVLARELGLRVRELPVRWSAIDGSTVRLARDPAVMLLDVLRLRRRHRHREPRPRTIAPDADRWATEAER
jgi:glycosyltransferase involved in cell wall biosynthesis